ncbi:MAG TPA: hypothetical protein VGD80_09900, partial [Kofleriaceae bacterium]
MRIRFAQVEVRRDLVVRQREYHLHDPGDAGRGLEVPDVGLHRADQDRVIAEHLAERLHLDGVAERRPGAVRLDVINIARGQARASEGAP